MNKYLIVYNYYDLGFTYITTASNRFRGILNVLRKHKEKYNKPYICKEFFKVYNIDELNDTLEL